jgi:magnesium transporter
MARFLKKQSPSEIKAFGKLGFVGIQKMERPIIDVINFSSGEIEQHEDISVDELEKYKELDSVSWINVSGLHDTEIISRIGETFELHPMVIDKITNTDNRPSFEDYDDYLILVLKMLHMDKEEMVMHSEHILFALFENVLITFQENKDDPFGPIRERMMKSVNRVRKGSTDYLLFALIRAINNQYTHSIEFIGQKIEKIEDLIFSQQSKDLLEELNDYNLEINYTSKIIRPAKDAVISICKSDSVLISEEQSQYIINNVHDSILIVSDSCENYRVMLHDQLNIYHTNVSTRLNEMFRVLTIFSVIFVPMTFIAGIYGMNFEVIPELSNPYGYYMVWAVMLVMAFSMLIYFRRKGWL